MLSAIDVSVAFLQANPYHEDDTKRYVSYKLGFSQKKNAICFSSRSSTFIPAQPHIVVPIEWDPGSKIYKLHPTVHVNNVRFERVIYPLKMGPVQDNMTDIYREGD